MSLYIYLKKDNSVKRKMVNYFSYVTLVFGVLLLFWSFYPILSFELYSRLFIQNNIQSPLPKSMTASSLEQANSVLGSTHSVFSNNLRDFTDVKLWFPNTAKNYHLPNLALKEYQLSIPKINIKDARVVVNGEDLSKYLVHFMAQSAPKDYKTIFTYLPSLEKKDHIYLKVNDISYEYEIFDMFVIDPDQVSVLEQRNDASYLTLITCVPPGTFWKRLVIRAKLTKLPNTF